MARRRGDLGRSAERILEREGIHRIKDITPRMAVDEIKSLHEQGYKSGTIAGYSKVLSDAHQLLHGVPIDFGSLVPSRSSDAPTQGRGYSDSQTREIIAHQPPVFGFMSEIVRDAGLRPSEIMEIRPADEFPARIAPDRAEKLVDHRFAGHNGIDYTVTGKGGLERTVRLSPDISDRLEAFRLDEAREVQSIRGEDNRVFGQHFDLPHYEEWARNFSDVSNDLFGHSNGSYGLRHSFVHARLETLQDLGYTWDQSRLAVSNALGHFRISEISSYER